MEFVQIDLSKVLILRSFRRRQWMENKKIKAILPISINVSFSVLVKPKHSPQYSEQPQPDQPKTWQHQKNDWRCWAWNQNKLYNQISQELISVMDLAKNTEVGGNRDGGDDEIVEKITFQKVEQTHRVFYLLTL